MATRDRQSCGPQLSSHDTFGRSSRTVSASLLGVATYIAYNGSWLILPAGEKDWDLTTRIRSLTKRSRALFNPNECLQRQIAALKGLQGQTVARATMSGAYI